MKNKFSRPLQALLCMAALLFTAPTRADVGTIDVGLTNFVAAQTGYFGTAYATNAIPVDNVDNFDLIYTGSGSAAGTSNIRISLCPAADTAGSLLATNMTFDFTFPAAGATRVVWRTNFPVSVVGSAGAFYVLQITNANATCNMTNQSLTVIKKKLR